MPSRTRAVGVLDLFRLSAERFVLSAPLAFQRLSDPYEPVNATKLAGMMGIVSSRASGRARRWSAAYGLLDTWETPYRSNKLTALSRPTPLCLELGRRLQKVDALMAATPMPPYLPPEPIGRGARRVGEGPPSLCAKADARGACALGRMGIDHLAPRRFSVAALLVLEAHRREVAARREAGEEDAPEDLSASGFQRRLLHMDEGNAAWLREWMRCHRLAEVHEMVVASVPERRWIRSTPEGLRFGAALREVDEWLVAATASDGPYPTPTPPLRHRGQPPGGGD